MELQPKAIKFTKDEEGFSVLLKDDGLKFEAWINIYIEEGDFVAEWKRTNFKNYEKYLQDLQNNNKIFYFFTTEAIRYLAYEGQIYNSPNGWCYLNFEEWLDEEEYYD